MPIGANRAILAHYDSYSAALLFARWDNASTLWPAPLPEGASAIEAPAAGGDAHDSDAVLQAMAQFTGIAANDIVQVPEFSHWVQTDAGPVRVHMLRLTTPDAPKPAIEAQGGSFRAISQLRGTAMSELLLLKQIFDMIIGGAGARA